MVLTFRQKSFLNRLLDIYQQARRPLHYTEVARLLGIGKSSAYEMLRLLEREGLVLSEYVLPKESPSPGRSHVRFWPTVEAEEILCLSPTNSEEERKEWERLKARVLDRLRHEKDSNCKSVLREVKSTIRETQSPLVISAEVLTILLLSLKEVEHSFRLQSPLVRLLGVPASKVGMSLAAGLAVGMLQVDSASRYTFDQLNEYITRYELALAELSPEKLEALRRYAQDILSSLRPA